MKTRLPDPAENDWEDARITVFPTVWETEEELLTPPAPKVRSSPPS